MEDDNGLLEDMKFDAELDNFFAGNSTSGTVNLQPQPMSFGSPLEEDPKPPSGNLDPPKVDNSAGAGAGGAAVAAAAAAAATALMGGKLGVAQGLVGGAVESMANAAVPTSLQPVKETAGKFLQKAQPWRQFLWPFSIPDAKEGCSRITANIYNFQTNYAILFVMQLVVSIVMQPSALICIGIICIVWVFFLKKNDDPDWAPVVGGMQLGPTQRWLALAAITALLLLFVAGSTIFNASLFYVLCAFGHGVLHIPPEMSNPASAAGDVGGIPL